MIKRNEIQETPVHLPGTVWGITTFFNPARYKNKSCIYHIFRESSKNQGLNLLTVELAFDNNSFELEKKDADILIQLRTKKENILWQKEAMLNIGLNKLPQECDKIVWLDCDIIFKNSNWISETSKLLEKYSIIQPFQYCVRLSKGQQDLEDFELNQLVTDKKDININKSIVYSIFSEKEDDFNNYSWPGYAWAGRKNIFDKIKFFDYGIIGSGDQFMADAFTDNYPKYTMEIYSDEMKKKYIDWSINASKEINKSVSFTKGVILHLWHGETKNRYYFDRHRSIGKLNFNPDLDLNKNDEGLWEISPNRSVLQKTLFLYFLARNEEGTLKNFLLYKFVEFFK